MCCGGLKKDLRRTRPDGDQTAGTGCLLELTNVFAHLLGQVDLGFALFYIRAVEFANIILVENGLARLNRGKEGLDLLQEIFFKDAGLGGGSVHVVFENIPACEDKIIQTSERNKILYGGRVVISAFTKPDGSHLRQGSDRFRQLFPDCFDASDKGGRNSAHSGDHDAELTLRRLNRSLGWVVNGLRAQILPSCHEVALPYESRACQANGYVLVPEIDLQLRKADRRGGTFKGGNFRVNGGTR